MIAAEVFSYKSTDEIIYRFKSETCKSLGYPCETLKYSIRMNHKGNGRTDLLVHQKPVKIEHQKSPNQVNSLNYINCFIILNESITQSQQTMT